MIQPSPQRQQICAQYPTPLDLFYRWENETPSQVFLRQAKAGQWTSWTYEQAGVEIRKIAAYLRGKNFPKGSHIAIFSRNCAQWLMMDLAIWMAGHVSVPIYANSTALGLRQILEHCQARAIWVGPIEDTAVPRNGIPENVIRLEIEELANSPLVGTPRRAHDETATIVYTSGTTGAPKGAVHDFGTLAVVAMGTCETHALQAHDHFFSFLPLAHVGERAVVQLGCLGCGGSISFAQSLDTFFPDLVSAQPQVLLAVPRILMRLQAAAGPSATAQTLGLGRVRCVITGAAPVPPVLLEWYQRLGVEVREGYGMTENFAYSHANAAGHNKIGWSGQPVKHAEAKISSTGEVLVKTPSNMLGYYQAPELTAAMFDGEFLRTGDLGEIDAQGYLRITGRLKDIFKTLTGKYVCPVPIEAKLLHLPGIQQTCVMGAGLPYPVAVVVLSNPAKNPQTQAALEHGLNQLNQQLEKHERLAKIIVAREAWTPHNNLLTPTLKMKRTAVEALFLGRMTNWLASREQVVWE